MKNERNVVIDILRTIGLLLIVLAHSVPPDYIYQLRNFDVPLMVFVSGLSFNISHTHTFLGITIFLKELKDYWLLYIYFLHVTF